MTENFNNKLEEAGFYRVLLESTTPNSQGFPLQYCLGLKTTDLAKATTIVRDLLQYKEIAERYASAKHWNNEFDLTIDYFDKVSDYKKDAELCHQLTGILVNHCGETGENEGAVETLKRKITDAEKGISNYLKAERLDEKIKELEELKHPELNTKLPVLKWIRDGE